MQASAGWTVLHAAHAEPSWWFQNCRQWHLLSIQIQRQNREDMTTQPCPRTSLRHTCHVCRHQCNCFYFVLFLFQSILFEIRSSQGTHTCTRSLSISTLSQASWTPLTQVMKHAAGNANAQIQKGWEGSHMAEPSACRCEALH